MNGLLIDTSQNPSILSLIVEGTPVKTEFLEGKSSALFPHLKEFCNFKEIDYIAIGKGPGSYIGIRTGAAIAKTLSYALEIPLVEFPSPLAFVPNVEGSFTVVGDAKMGELFIMEGDTSLNLSSHKLIAPEELIVATDFVIDLRKPLTPHLELLSKYVHKQFMQGNILAEEGLNLTYLR